MRQASLKAFATVCDPWNGSDTTTQVAYDLGYSALGYDLNPVMVVVARSRLVEISQISMLQCMMKHILGNISSRNIAPAPSDDPLNLWMSSQSVNAIRHVERMVREEYKGGSKTSKKRMNSWDVSKEIAVFFTSIFSKFVSACKGIANFQSYMAQAA